MELALPHLPKLQYLLVAENKIQSLPEDLRALTPTLEVIVLASNKLVTVDGQTLPTTLKQVGWFVMGRSPRSRIGFVSS